MQKKNKGSRKEISQRDANVERMSRESSQKRKRQDRNKAADVENGLEDTGRGKGKLGRSERVAWTYIHYQM